MNGRIIGAVRDAKGFVCAVFADQTADVVIAVNDTVFQVDVFKGQIPLAIADHNGKAVPFVVIFVIVHVNTVNGKVSERGVCCGTEDRDAVVAVVHPEIIDGVTLSVEGALKVIVPAVIDVFAAADIAEIDLIQVDIHVQVHSLSAVGRAGARVVNKLREALGGRDMVVGKAAAVPGAVPDVRRACGGRERQTERQDHQEREQHAQNAFAGGSLHCHEKHPFL